MSKSEEKQNSKFQVQIPAGVSMKVASDLGLGLGFQLVLLFPPPILTG